MNEELHSHKETQVCPYCENPLAEDTTFCQYCERELNLEDIDRPDVDYDALSPVRVLPDTPPATPRSQVNPVVIVLIVALLLVACGVCVVLGLVPNINL